ncbi:methyltransferase [Nocardioides flavus (ex Wang et al. 2016)]|uniref:Methyltransferase n=1 Tax=Nocardioides flavus (ex Wang et al. 2016) TaxID=2058780 RepID=A0ABQ3HM58_9ACTN|nr:class I SAM-dependent methyltransferase [Nocardioides flavus (ex Wang et al. 2016)]GHE18336.1 methyltransferase [Nocardioides flavus (ex Wang et al. 2016)]
MSPAPPHVAAGQPGSSSLRHDGYWWHRARTELLGAVMTPHLAAPRRTLDVGSADAPSVGWMRGEQQHVSLDLFPEGLRAGEGVVGSATDLPFADATFDVVSAFDVVEHCADDTRAVAELARVLVPGGRMLLSVPAYAWAWSDHDVRAGHHRRYTRPALVDLVEGVGMRVVRATYAFAGVFPLFAVERLARRVRPARPGDARLPEVSPRVDRALTGVCHAESRILRRHDLPFGSSVLLAAVRPGRSDRS